MSEGKKIVFVDDDKWLLDLYTEKLKLEGFEVYGASNGKEGFNLIQQVNPDLIVSDVVMPGGDGFDLLKKIRGTAETHDIKLINLTNLANEQDEEQLKKLGSDGYLVKADYTPSQFTAKVKAFLGMAD